MARASRHTSRSDSNRLQYQETGIENGLGPGNFSPVRADVAAENALVREES